MTFLARRREPEGEEVEGVSGYPDGEGRHERETDEAVTVVLRERVRQLTANKLGMCLVRI